MKYPCNSNDCTPYEVSFSPGLYQIELWGAQGGYNITEFGARGAYTKGTLKTKKPIHGFIFLGERGTRSGPSTYNGGGHGSVHPTLPETFAGSGGGASDFRLKFGSWDDRSSLLSRIMIAGGGAGDHIWEQKILGGYGGLIGQNGSIYTNADLGHPITIPTGGTQTSGGLGTRSDWHNGTDGQLGIGGATQESRHGSGAGGGYYGGGGGSWTHLRVTAGGGGSSFISGHPECVAIDQNGSPTDSSIHFSKIKFENTEIINGSTNLPMSVFGSYDGFGMAQITVLFSIPECTVYCPYARNVNFWIGVIIIMEFS